jgi:hypothetical protein
MFTNFHLICYELNEYTKNYNIGPSILLLIVGHVSEIFVIMKFGKGMFKTNELPEVEIIVFWSLFFLFLFYNSFRISDKLDKVKQN